MPSIKPSTNNKHISKDDICFLMTSITTFDDLRQETITTIPEMVYCAVISISQQEYSVTMQNGLKERLTIIIDHDEYDSQKLVEYNRTMYSVYRTFVRSDGDIELYCEIRAGVQNGN